MSKFKKLFSGGCKDSDKPLEKFIHNIEVQYTRVDTEKFAKAVVREYGETLVLLGKE